jgi:putative transposase
MARHVRDLATSTWFHVFNRGADRQDIFSGDGDYVLFEQLLQQAVDRFAIEAHAYVLMSNHFHLLLHCPQGQISTAMQRICGQYGAAFNQRTQREGPVFTSRFKSVPVSSDAQLVQVGRYIHRNPLAIVPARALHTYRWSSLGAIVGTRRLPGWLSTGTVFESDGDPVRYLQYVLEPRAADVSEASRTAFSFDQIERAVVASSGTDAHSILAVTPGRAHPTRVLAITLAVELRTAPVTELAARYGVDAQSIRRTARQGRIFTATSATFAGLRQATLHTLRRECAA